MTFAPLLTDIHAPIKRWETVLYTIAHKLIAFSSSVNRSRETLSCWRHVQRLGLYNPSQPHQDGNDPMMRSLLCGVLAGWSMLAAPALAADRLVVVELFTSQGCPSCPPADGFFEQLAARDDVLALSLHVDYWDYIGWEDTFGSPDHTARQRGYAKASERKMVYTPQMIINGADHVVGTRLKDVTDLIDKHHSRSAEDIAVSLNQEGDTIHLSARTPEPRSMPLAVHLVRYLPEETVEIERGE